MSAPLKIDESGNVGIRLSNNTIPLSNLSIGAAGLSNAKLYITEQWHLVPETIRKSQCATWCGGRYRIWECATILKTEVP